MNQTDSKSTYGHYGWQGHVLCGFGGQRSTRERDM